MNHDGGGDDKVRLVCTDSSRLEFWRTVNQFYLDGVHCDLSLRCSGQGRRQEEVRCHRIVLAALSPMVRAALTTATRSSDGEEGQLIVVTLSDLSHADVKATMDEIYSFLATKNRCATDQDRGVAEEVLGIDLEGFVNGSRHEHEYQLVKKEEVPFYEQGSDGRAYFNSEDNESGRDNKGRKWSSQKSKVTRAKVKEKTKRAVKRKHELLQNDEEEKEEDYFSPIQYADIALKDMERDKPSKRGRSRKQRMLATIVGEDEKSLLNPDPEVDQVGTAVGVNGKRDTRVCEVCGLKCPTPRALYRHKFNNHTERECKYCPARVVGTLSLVSHMRRLHPAEYTGHNKTPAVCAHCGKTLGSADSMRRHVLMLHTEEGDKPCKCAECPRGFPNPSALRAHVIMAHVRNRPFACRVEGCAVAYNDNASLHTHERKAHGLHHNSKRSKKKSQG